MTGEVCQVAQMLVSLVTLPIQDSLAGSSLASLSSGSVIMPRLTVASTVPSLGATPYTNWVAFRLPAPGMFWTTMAGLPGRWRPMWRPSSRA